MGTVTPMRPALLSLKNLRKEFRHPLTLKRLGGLKDITFDVLRGETFGLLGPNGAGKTTTIKLILGLIRPSGGSGTLLGHPLGSLEARKTLGYLPENPYFYDYLTAREFLDLCGSLSGMDSRARRARVDELLEELDLARAEGLPMRKYSKGMVQRVGLAQAILSEPQFLVLDEPMSGLDPIGRRLVRDIVMKLKRKGTTILMSSHILPDVEHLCDRVGILARGELKACLTLSDISAGARGGGEVRVRGLKGRGVQRWPGDPDVEVGADTSLFRLSDVRMMNSLLRALLAEGAEILAVQREQKSLEEVFVHLLEEADLPPQQLRAS